MHVAILVPVKPLASAKTRLRADIGGGADDLVLAMALDVVAAAKACRAVAEVALLTSDLRAGRAAALLGARVLPDVGDGLNAALEAASAAVRQRRSDACVIAQPADCPSVTAADIAALIGWVDVLGRRVFISDATGSGTTSLAAPAGYDLDPQYGIGSCEAHAASGAQRLRGPRWDRAGRDVDTASDLAEAVSIGVGPHTTAWLRRR